MSYWFAGAVIVIFFLNMFNESQLENTRITTLVISDKHCLRRLDGTPASGVVIITLVPIFTRTFCLKPL